eukprot:CAMPEP_0114170092 /NCGR_PEP_ID=MMETSP0043_2-20121206/33943_1 /TAXON_ID=464988 /ORGANISM="Hemiselmis andersenii, Strain CCMP644" /LENGTH=167 /DNA_ID=CAMNT_0001267649 /DNA_START=13 /DNA_END=513 /DNA_ORIENTATION=-
MQDNMKAPSSKALRSPSNRVLPALLPLPPERHPHGGRGSLNGGRKGAAGSGTHDSPTADNHEQLDQVPPLPLGVRESSWLGDAGRSFEQGRFESLRFQCGPSLFPQQLNKGDPHIEMSLTIKPLPCLITPTIERAVEANREQSKKRRAEILEFNKHIVLPPDSVFPE